MKIGQFSKLFEISTDTVRYYVELGLIIPQKKGGQYDYDQTCEIIMNQILTYKKLGFKLSEIKDLIAYEQVGKLLNYKKTTNYQNIINRRYSQVLNEYKKLENTLKELSKIKDNVIVEEKNSIVIGLPFWGLDYLFCSKCNSKYSLAEGRIEQNQIMEGRLECSCHNDLTIEDGIICSKSRNTKNPITFENAQYILDHYVEKTNAKYIEKIRHSLDWTSKHAPLTKFSGQTIVELGSGLGFYLRNNLDSLPEDSVYIAIDNEYNRHLKLKTVLQEVACKKKILFICCDFLDMPLSKHSIDVLIDYTGTTNYSFDHMEFLLDQIDDYTHENTILTGSYIVFDKFQFQSKIKPHVRDNFKQEHIKKRLTRLGYQVENDILFSSVSEGGIFEDFFVEGEKVSTYLFYGKKLKQ